MSRREVLKDKLRASSTTLRVRTKHLGWRLKSKAGDVLRAICNAGESAAAAPQNHETTSVSYAPSLLYDEEAADSHGSRATTSPDSPLGAEEELGQTLIKVAAARDAQAVDKPRLKVRVRSGSSATRSRSVTPRTLTTPMALTFSAVVVTLDYAPIETSPEATTYAEQLGEPSPGGQAFGEDGTNSMEEVDALEAYLSRWASSDGEDSLDLEGLDDGDLEEVFGPAIGYDDRDPYGNDDARSYLTTSPHSHEESDSVSTGEGKEDIIDRETALGLPMNGSPAKLDTEDRVGTLDTILEDEFEGSEASLLEFALELAPPSCARYALTY
ncbi:hypothetical protein RB595_008751 [Gaeumannomyces hyphopodioides]